MNWVAVTRAMTKPLQAAVRSKAAAWVAPICAWMAQALPKRSSGLEVAKMTRSMSLASTPVG